MTTTRESDALAQLAVNGGPAAVTEPLPPMYPGGMRIGAEEEAAVLEVLRGKRLFRYYGPGEDESKVERLETAAAEVFGVRHVLGVSSGCMALAAGLAALGVGPGDEVIVPAYTWIATAAAVLLVGGVPVIAEVDEALTLDPQDAEKKVTSRTRAVIPVHMRGTACEMDGLMDVAGRHGLGVVEDTAQAFGASYLGRRLGTIGDIGAFSLQFNKVLTSGEGGLLMTGNQELFERALMFHDVAAGARAELRDRDTFVATTCRMSELHGAVALAQLGKLSSILADMRRNFSAITGSVEDVVEAKPVSWRHQWDPAGDAGLAIVMFLDDAATAHRVAGALRAEGIRANVMFDETVTDFHVAYHWKPLIAGSGWSHATPWTSHGRAGIDPATCPRTHALLGRAVHLDVSPDLTDNQAAQVAAGLRKVLSTLL